MIYSQAIRQGRRWVARHWGSQLDGMRVCKTMREESDYLKDSFSEMFRNIDVQSDVRLALPTHLIG